MIFSIKSRTVQYMNSLNHETSDDIKAFQLLAEVADEQPVSQRELAKRLGIALGLVNSYIKNFIAKGYIRVKSYPSNRYAYLLTPQGISEKARMACRHAHYFTSLYTITRQNYLQLFKQLSANGITRVAFCGVDEVAEIAWLSLREAGLELAEVMDDRAEGDIFMGKRIVNLNRGILSGNHHIIITSVKRAEELHIKLLDLGGNNETIMWVKPPEQ